MNEKIEAIITLCVLGLVAGGLIVIVYTAPPPTTVLLLQTTTSMRDSGLLDLVKSGFDAKYDVNLEWIAAGTGQAIAAAGRGDGDVVIAHSLTYEREFINHSSTKYDYSGQGIFRVTFAYNYFVIVGPTTDPANVTGMATVDNGTLIFKRICDAAQNGVPGVIFASRGDKSGTNTKEEQIWAKWKLNGTVQTETWYKSLGKGMGDTLTQANEMKAYTLTDYGTWLKMRSGLTNLEVVSAKQPKDLKNTYSVMVVDPQKHPMVKFDLAVKFVYFMVHEGQDIIGNYTIDGELVFNKLVKPDCWCHSSLCPVCNGTFHLTSSSSCSACYDDCLLSGTLGEPSYINPFQIYGTIPLMLPISY